MSMEKPYVPSREEWDKAELMARDIRDKDPEKYYAEQDERSDQIESRYVKIDQGALIAEEMKKCKDMQEYEEGNKLIERLLSDPDASRRSYNRSSMEKIRGGYWPDVTAESLGLIKDEFSLVIRTSKTARLMETKRYQQSMGVWKKKGYTCSEPFRNPKIDELLNKK